MSIYLHPLDEKPYDIHQESFVEIDFVSWESNNSDFPVGLTLLRRLNTESKKPYLQELMFEGLYRGLAIKKLILEIPNGPNESDVNIYSLNGVKVMNYNIYPSHPENKKPYEKIVLVAKTIL